MYKYKFGEMSLETAKATLEFAKKNVMENGHIWFFGGEPTVRWDIIKFFIDEIKKQNLKFTLGMTTNGYLLDEEKLNYIKENHPNFGILFSIDGVKETHDKFRVTADGKPTWEKVFSNLKLAEKILGRKIEIRWTFGPGTIVGLADAVKKYVEEYKIYAIALGAVFEVDWSEKDYRDFRAEMEKLREYAIGWYRKGIPFNAMPIRDGLAPIIGAGGTIFSRCGLGQGEVGVTPNGWLSLCHRFCNSLAEGDEMKIGDVWNGIDYKKREEIYKRWISFPIVSEEPERCKTCIYKPWCFGSCLALNFDMFGNMHVVPKTICEYYRIVTEVFLPMGHLMLAENNQAFRQAFGVGGFITAVDRKE